MKRKELKELKEFVLREGSDEVEVRLTKGCHYRVRLQVGNEQRHIIFPSTPSDPRGLKNFRARVRRTLRQMKGERK